MFTDPIKHRVIGIRHALKVLREAGLISSGVTYPEDAVLEISKVYQKAANAKRYRVARSDSSIPSMIKTIEETFNLPSGSVSLSYPSGRKAGTNATVGSLRKNWKANTDE